MDMSYRRCGRTTSKINYHLVFCTHYRRRIFQVAGVEARTQELARQICEQNDFILLEFDCQADYCHLYINVPPTTSAGEAVRVFKNGIAGALLKEFPAFGKMRNLWTWDYFATTSPRLNKAEVENFLRMQKTRS